MKVTKLFAIATTILGLAITNIVMAETTVTHYTDSDISYTLNGNELFTGVGTITITDSTTTITILDRNLGATVAGTGCEDPSWGSACAGGDSTYGYHFQRGNNYGFDPNSTPTTGTQLTSLSTTYNPFYTNPIFIVGSQNWYNDNSRVDLWGGSTSDYIDEIDGTNWQVSNATGRQGPCPENFHVPSYGELLKIKNMMGDDASAIHSQLLVPFAGYRGYHVAEVYYLGSSAHLRSSSPYSTETPYSRYLTLYEYGEVVVSYDYRADAYSLRCVYDSYETYTPSGNLSSEGGEGKVVVNIAALNSGQNTCSGEDFVFPVISASPSANIIKLARKFSCVFGNKNGVAVTLQLSGDLTDGNGNVIPGANVRLSNPAWTQTPEGLKDGNTAFSGQTFQGSGQTLFNKVENMIGIAEGSGIEIEITIPGGTPNGTYNGTLVLTF